MRVRLLFLPLLAALPLAARAAGQEETAEPRGWTASGELTFVDTSGNAEATTFGFGGTAVYDWEAASLSFEAAGLRAETGTTTRRAIGTPDDFRLVETHANEVTAESYLLRTGYDRDIREALVWFSGFTWERNEFAGFDSRASLVAGLGNLWLESEKARWKTTYGLTYTVQDDLVDDPEVADEFAGLRATSDYARQLTPTTEYTSLLIVDESLDDTDDLRADFTNAVAVSLTSRLALKVGLQLLFDRQPALGEVPLEAPDGAPTGEVVTFELDDLDTILRTALVVKL